MDKSFLEKTDTKIIATIIISIAIIITAYVLGN